MENFEKALDSPVGAGFILPYRFESTLQEAEYTMLSIGQFSNICKVGIKTLRYYDKIRLLIPAKTDPDTGYRYYNDQQLSKMLLIQRLKRYGFSLGEIKSMLSCNDQHSLARQLAQQIERLRRQVAETQYVITELEHHLLNLERTGDIMSYQDNYEIHLVNTDAITVVSCRQKMSVNDFGTYYGTLFEKIAKEQLHPSGKVMALYHDKEFDPACSDIELAVSIQESDKANRIIPGELCAATTHYGPYASLTDAYAAVVKWLGESEYEVVDCPYEIYRKTQFDKLPPNEWETDIFFPVRKKN